MKKYLTILLAMLPFSLFTQNNDGFGYDDFKKLFQEHGCANGEMVEIPHNGFTDFLFNDQYNLIYHALEIATISEDLDLFVINKEVDYSGEKYTNDFYLLFKDKKLIGEYKYYGESYRVLGIDVTNDGVSISQSYNIQNDKTIFIEYQLIDCCSSSGFEIPIEIKTKIILYVDEQGELIVKDVPEWEISSIFFNTDFQAPITSGQDHPYPTEDFNYEIIIDNNNVHIPITANNYCIFFYFENRDGKLVPVITSKNQKGQILDTLVLGKDMKKTGRTKTQNGINDCKPYSYPLCLKMDDKQVILSLDDCGRFVVE